MRYTGTVRASAEVGGNDYAEAESNLLAVAEDAGFFDVEVVGLEEAYEDE